MRERTRQHTVTVTCHIKSSWRDAFLLGERTSGAYGLYPSGSARAARGDDGRFGHGDGHAHGTCMLQHVASWGSWERDFASQQGGGLGDQSKDALLYVFHFIPMDGHSIQFQEFNVFRVCLSLRSSWHCPICIFKETVSSHGGFIEVTGFEWVLEALRCFDVFGWRIVHCRMFRAREEVSPQKCRRGKQQKTAIWNATHFGMFRNHVVTTVHGQYRAVGQPKVSQITREAFNKVVGALQGSYFMNGFHWVAASNRAGFLVQALLSWIRP